MSSTSSIQNRAAFLDEPGTPLRVGDAPTPVPDPEEVLIEVHAVAINPVDTARQAAGFNIPSYPWISGSDAAGVAKAVGADVSNVKPGDHVIAAADEWSTGKRTNSAFQEYMATSYRGVSKIPNSLPFTDACVVPLGLSTAAGMLFESVTLNLRLPMSATELEIFQHPSPPEVVTVWGGSSSLGANAIQMARAAGYRVIGIARQQNFDLMKQCGADACFDYTDARVVDNIVALVEEKGWVSAGIAAVAGFIPPGPVAEQTTKLTGELALKLGGKKFVSTCLARGFMPELPMPEGVQTSNCLAIVEEDIKQYIWQKWLPAALETGLLKPLPRADVVGEGLDSIGAAVEVAGRGVSGKKIVVKVR